jgi:hypothetical protein
MFYYSLLETERLYAKDGRCPTDWQYWVNASIPEYLIPFGKGDLSDYLENEVREVFLLFNVTF